MAVSIRTRLRHAMIGLSLTLCLVFTVLLFVIVFTTEDQVFINQLKAERNAYEEDRLRSNPNLTPSSRRFKLVESSDSLPLELTAATRDRVLAATGIHEYFDDQKAYFIDHFQHPTTGASTFLIFDVSDLLAVRGNKLPIFITIIILTLLVILCAILIANSLVKRALKPVRKLSDELQHSALDDVVIELAHEFSGDEISILTHELAAALSRARAAAQREFEFNRGVSHELRSPIQVAQSATELLELFFTQIPDKESTQNVLPRGRQAEEYVGRLKRAMTEMNEITETFLWLANNREVETGGTYSVAALAQTLATIQAAYPTINLRLESQLKSDFEYPLPEKFGAVVVRNLLRNALSHGKNKAITLVLKKESIAVENYANKRPSSGTSFGVGLSLVQRICERARCEFSSSLGQEGIYRAIIKFKK